MNVSHHADQAYASATMPVATGRSAEYRVIAQITARLAKAAKAARKNYPEFVEALHANSQLWTNLATDIVDDQNGLPESLRARLFYLSEFTRLHTAKVLKKEAGIRPLIEINSAILNGLSDKGHK